MQGKAGNMSLSYNFRAIIEDAGNGGAYATLHDAIASGIAIEITHTALPE
jgi:hypothetical protein